MSNERRFGARRSWGMLLCLLLILAAGCAEKNQFDDLYVGNMNDSSYAGQVTPGGVTQRVNADGNMVAIEEFKGHFVWADYAAPWCQPCIPQAQAIKQLETSLGERVVFLTVMTSASQEYESIPDQQNAKAWANRFGLDPGRVVAATNLWAWTIPTHILYSPAGHTLYRSTGYLSADQINNVLSRYMQDWEEWSKSGRTAQWMKTR